MAKEHLAAELKAVDWNKAVAEFLTHTSEIEAIDKACLRIAIWAKQLETVDKNNPALAFVRALQSSAQHVTASCSLGLYRSAAASIRSIVENGLYYSYFRSHPDELATLVRDPGYYLSRGELVSYHKDHTINFRQVQEKLGFLTKLDKWYSDISAVVHGQIPGAWVEHVSLSGVRHDLATLKIVVEKFCEAEELLHSLLLLTVGRGRWDSFAAPAKKALLSGLHADIKTALGLDKA